MALAFADRVKETTTTTGTGTITLAGASAGYQSFSAIGNGNTTYYTIAAGSQWEVGVGTYTAAGTTLSRDTVLASSNGGALVNFSAGVKDVFCDYPAGKAVIQDVSGNVGIGTALPASKLDVNGITTTGNITVRGDGVEGGQITFNNLGNTAGPLTLDVDGFGRGRLFTTTNNADLILGQLIGTGGVITLSTSSLERMRIDTSGNVGIGTSAPAARLSVDTGAVGQIMTFRGAGLPFGFASGVVAGANALELTTADASGVQATRMILRGAANTADIEFYRGARGAETLTMFLSGTTGNVGVGTNAPLGPLQVVGAAYFGSASSQTTGTAAIYNDGNDVTIEAFAGNNTATKRNLLLATYGGNVGIGTATPGFKLQVNGPIGIPSDVNGKLDIGRFSSGFGGGAIDFTGGTFGVVQINSSEKVRITAAGLVGIGTSAPGYLLHGVQNGNAEFRVSATNVGTNSAGLTVENEGNRNWNLWANRSTDNFIIGANGRANDFLVINGSSGFVGIGTTSPSQRLTVQGDELIIPAAGWTSGQAARLYLGDTNNGVQSVNGGYSNYFAFNGHSWLISGSERMRIDSSGNVGIATSSPATPLDVAGTIRTSAGGSDPGTGTVLYYVGSGSFQTVIAGAAFAVHTGNNNARTERMRIDINGNAGIGTSSPGAKLDVTTASGANIVVSRSSAAGYAAFQRIAPAGQQVYDFYTINNTEAGRITVDGSNFMAFSTGSSATERMRIDGSGNVGIGSNVPSMRLDVYGGSLGTTAGNTLDITDVRGATGNNTRLVTRLVRGSNGSDWTTAALRLQAVVDVTNHAYIDMIPAGATYGLTFGTGGGTPVERMRIDGSGNVGIGTSSPAGRLDVVSTSAGGASFMRVANGSGAANSYAAISLDPGNNGFNTRDAQIRAINNGSNQISLTFLTSNAGTPFEAMRIDNVGNVGIGTASPDVRLSIQDAGAGQITLKDSGGTTRAYVMTNGAIGTAPTNALRLRGDAGIALGAVGSLAMFIDTSNNVGIGTTSPGDRLDVAGGNIRIANNYNLLFRNTAGTATARFLVQNDDNFVVYNASGTPISSFTQGSTNIAVYGSNGSNRMTVDSVNNVTHWAVNGSERMRIDGFGSVLIGTTSGGRSLCLFGSDVWQRIQNASRSWLIGLGTGSNFVIYDETGGGPRLTVEPATGNWIGPNSILLGSGQNNDNKIEIGTGRTGNNFAYVDLIGDTTYTDFGLRLLRGNGGPNTYSQLVHRGTGDMYITAQDAATLYFQTNATTRAYFQSDGTMVMNGALLVGRNTTGSNVNTNNDTGSFSVRGDASNAASISFHRTGAFAMNMGLGTDAIFRMGGWSMSSNCFQMDGSGNLTMLGNVTAYSDARIKKDVETIDSALDLVSKMRGVRYTRIDSGKRGVGVIAQEMLEVLPEVVQQGVGDDDTLSVAYGNLVGVLIEAIKELRAEIVELKGK